MSEERNSATSQARGAAGPHDEAEANSDGNEADETRGSATAAGMPQSGSVAASGDAAVRGSEGAEAESLAAQLEATQAELAKQKDLYLRAAAEAENIRRRAENEVAGARKFAIEGFAAELLAVRDSLEIARSLEINEGDTGVVAKMKEGLDLTLKQLDSALSKFSIAVVDPIQGDKLDPERHQAVTTQESDDVAPNHILAVIQKGYTIHDRLLRPAMVVVARKPQIDTRVEGETA